MAPDPPFNQFNGFTTYLRRPRVRATPPRLGGTPRPPVLDAGGRKSTVWRLDSRWQWDATEPRSSSAPSDADGKVRTSDHLQSFLKYDLVCSRKRSVPFWGRNGTAAPTKARLSAVIKREHETMPNTQNGTVRIAAQQPALRVVGEAVAPPRRQRNAERRPREYLTPAEVEMLILTARKRGRYGHRDATMILIAYRHG